MIDNQLAGRLIATNFFGGSVKMTDVKADIDAMIARARKAQQFYEAN